MEPILSGALVAQVEPILSGALVEQVEPILSDALVEEAVHAQSVTWTVRGQWLNVMV